MAEAPERAGRRGKRRVVEQERKTLFRFTPAHVGGMSESILHVVLVGTARHLPVPSPTTYTLSIHGLLASPSSLNMRFHSL